MRMHYILNESGARKAEDRTRTDVQFSVAAPRLGRYLNGSMFKYVFMFILLGIFGLSV